MRRLATWLVVGLLGALGLAAAITALVETGNGDAALSTEQRSTTVSLPGCREGQLALSIEEIPGDSLAVVLRHVSGRRCDVGRLPIATTIRDQRGELVPHQGNRAVFTGELSLGVPSIDSLVYLPRCDQRGPLVATAQAGDLTASGSLPVRLCLDPDAGVRRAVMRFDDSARIWQDFLVVEPGSRILIGRIDVPHRLPIEIWMERESPGVARIDLLNSRIDLLNSHNSGRHRSCRRNEDRDSCAVRLPLREGDFGEWRVVALKLSRDPAVVRMSLRFR
jgi:hypothetical protein